MFERFTTRARDAVTASATMARDAGAERIGPVHLLQAVLGSDNVAVHVLESYAVDPVALADDLARRGRTPGGLDEDDADALASIGIDLDEVLRHVAPASPTRRQPRFGKDARKVLELSLREAVALRHNYIGCEHLLLGIVRHGDPACRSALTDAGVDPATLRDRVRDAVRRAG